MALLTRLKTEGDKTKAKSCSASTQSGAGSARHRHVRRHGVDASGVSIPGGFSDPVFVPYDYGHFAVIYDTETLKSPPKSLKELVEGNPEEKIVISRTPGHRRPASALLVWMKAVYGDKAGEAWGKLKPRVLTVTPGWSEAYGLFTKGEAPMVLSYTTSPAYHMIAESQNRYQAAAFSEGHPIRWRSQAS